VVPFHTGGIQAGGTVPYQWYLACGTVPYQWYSACGTVPYQWYSGWWYRSIPVVFRLVVPVHISGIQPVVPFHTSGIQTGGTVPYQWYSACSTVPYQWYSACGTVPYQWYSACGTVPYLTAVCRDAMKLPTADVGRRRMEGNRGSSEQHHNPWCWDACGGLKAAKQLIRRQGCSECRTRARLLGSARLGSARLGSGRLVSARLGSEHHWSVKGICYNENAYWRPRVCSCSVTQCSNALGKLVPS
jgi:hypothetical protein